MKESLGASEALDKISQRRADTLASIAARAIERMIVDGLLASGDRINESRLAEQLGISRGPIREACRSLEQAGLLISAANKGMFVRNLSHEEARHLYELRAALASLAGRLIVERASDTQLAELADLVERMKGAVDADEAERYFRLNLEFHAALVHAAGNPALEDSYRRIVNQLHLTRRRGLVQAKNIHLSFDEHGRILAALQARDKEAAEKAMREHVENGLARLLQIN